ncbi:hypothetical protein [Limnobacter sp. SAORIC-690]|uniref:hypothetical protein n=1 Tax=Limnobacter sp. SAORIC-690 TaxID=1923970 RepID=UPI0014447A29|nr:hypothetical protein [Limnobacter sp. SAORIC-690]
MTEQPRDYGHLNFQDHYGFGLIPADPPHSGPLVQALEGISPCTKTSCTDRLAAAWFSVHEVD